jgi:hypothetical protein
MQLATLSNAGAGRWLQTPRLWYEAGQTAAGLSANASRQTAKVDKDLPAGRGRVQLDMR